MSNKVVVGFFPKQICYVSSMKRSISVGCEWDIDYGYDANNKKEEVMPAFPADNNDTKHLSTATSWAQSDIRMRNYHDTQNKKDEKDLPEPGKEVVDNDFIKGVRLLSIEQRGNGGRAYKAIVNNYYVDVREDVVMDTMLQKGIDAGGILKGEFIWAKCGSQMKLVRKDSELYKIIAEFESKKDKKPFSKKDLEVGGIYQTKKKERCIYLGNINSTVFNSPSLDKKAPPFWDSKAMATYDNDTSYFSFDSSPFKNHMLFYQIYKHESLEDGLDDMFSKTSLYRYDLKKSHTFIEKINQIDLGENIVEKVSHTFASYIKDDILEYTGHKDPKKNTQKITALTLARNICYRSAFLNMYESTQEPKNLFDVQKYILFS